MSSPSGSVIASNQRPRLHVVPGLPDRTFGDLAGQFAGDYGLTPEPWQQLVLDDWLAETGGRWSALRCGLACPRQNGKNGIIEVRELFGMVGRGEKILHTAHQVKTAQKHFRRLKHFFGKRVNDPGAKYPELNALVVELRQVNGQEAIILANGGSVEIVARSQGSGRGYTVDVLVLDEAQDLSDDDLEALMPTTSAAPLRNPQWIYTGTPPGPKASGEVFTRTRAEALGNPRRVSWHEWSVEASGIENIDLDDRDLWLATNPALGGRLQIEVCEGERGSFSPKGFARERLGWWEPGTGHVAAFDLERWSALADPAAERGAAPSFGVATAPDRSWSAIAVAWRRQDGLTQVMLSDYKPGDAWLVGRLEELRSRWGGTVHVGLKGLAGVAKAADAAVAHNALATVVEAREVRHGNEPALTTSVRGARWRTQGDSRVLDRKGSVDISPLDAAALAVHGALSAPTAQADFRTVDQILEAKRDRTAALQA